MNEGKKLMFSIVGVVLVLGGAVTWLVLGMSQFKKLDAAVGDATSKREVLQQKVAGVAALRQEKKKLGGELDEYETILPNDRELERILDTLSEFEKDSGVHIKSFTPDRERMERPGAQTTSYKKVSYKIELNGDFFQVVKFVNLLENYKRFVQIDGFEIKQKELGSITNDAALQLSTFVYDPKAAPKKTAAKPAPAGVARTKAAKPAGEPEAPFNVNEEMGSRFVFASFDGSRVRDPFSNPLTKRPDGKVDPRKGPAVAVAPMKLQPGESEADVCKRVEAQLAQIRQLIDSGSFDKAAPVWADTQRLLSVNFKDATCAKKAAELRQAASRFGATMETTTGEQCATLVQGVLAQMQKAFDAGTYDEVDALFNTVRPVVKKIGESSNESLPDLVKACETLISRAQVRREFAGIALNIQGTFWSGSGSSRRAAVIINGQVLSEGERVKLTPAAAKMGKGSTKTLVETPLDAEVIVKKIEREKVTFLYRNELIERFQFQDR